MRFMLAVFIVFLVSAQGIAEERSIIDAWYDALKDSDRGAFKELLDENVVIDLKQLGITQTKSEFLSSLDAWDQVVSGLTLSYSWEGIDATSATATVCYKFGNDAYTNLETFVVNGGKFMRVEQERLMEGC